ncbi:MAG: hypothetical protein US54_C0056G0004 [Candidatus Roizmanbacteria bacterium GW2011_GWA2_37_7]|uniref:PIN domain-containing protein n=1 Tax=Candidatus Roizmanbacteria bacterium GW2011_GWA2_37_7 TaxID=1618481 RepID=A0A0G0K812_9BACT|nr:MAG: hypothetical protein US54_C0056G0004 [Candidatus Roizmanbacteria bacterium GW2011_GWA2_37_7]
MSVYFDASIIIAGLLSPDGGSTLLLKLVKKQIIVGITSQTVIDEILDKKEKILRSKTYIEGFILINNLIVRKRLLRSEIKNCPTVVDQNDAHVVVGAQKTHCTHLVTLDKKHLLRADVKYAFKPLKILTPGEMLEELALDTSENRADSSILVIAKRP